MGEGIVDSNIDKLPSDPWRLPQLCGQPAGLLVADDRVLSRHRRGDQPINWLSLCFAQLDDADPPPQEYSQAAP